MNTTADAVYPAAAQTTATKPKSKLSIWMKIYIGFTVFVLTAICADWMWTNSGSAEWKLVKDEDGVQLYRLKLPGTKLLKWRTVMVGDYTLGQLVSQHIIDDNLKTCKEWIPTCVGFERLMEFDPVKGYDKDLWIVDFPAPFSDRELLISTIFSQDRVTKEVALDVVSEQNALPYHEGFVRGRMHNRWTFKPVGNGKVQVQLIQDTDLGGFFPYFLFNMATASESHKFFATDLRKFLKQEQYVNAKFDFIEEP